MTFPIGGNPNSNSVNPNEIEVTMQTGSLEGGHTISHAGTGHVQEVSTEVSSCAESAIEELGAHEEIMSSFSQTSKLFQSDLRELLSKLDEISSQVEATTQEAVTNMDSLVQEALSTVAEATGSSEAPKEKTQSLFSAIRSSLSNLKQLCSQWMNRMSLGSSQSSSQRGSASGSYRPEISASSPLLITPNNPKIQWSIDFVKAAAHFGLEERPSDDGNLAFVDPSAQGAESIYEVPDPVGQDSIYEVPDPVGQDSTYDVMTPIGEGHIYETVLPRTSSTEHSYAATGGVARSSNEDDIEMADDDYDDTESVQTMGGTMQLWDIGGFQAARTHLREIIERGDTIENILNDIENSSDGISDASIMSLDSMLQGLNALRSSLEMRLDVELPFVSDA